MFYIHLNLIYAHICIILQAQNIHTVDACKVFQIVQSKDCYIIVQKYNADGYLTGSVG